MGLLPRPFPPGGKIIAQAFHSIACGNVTLRYPLTAS